jgi:hypothetical protein
VQSPLTTALIPGSLTLVEGRTSPYSAALWALAFAESCLSSGKATRVLWVMETPHEERVQDGLMAVTAALCPVTPGLLPFWSCRPTEAQVGRAAALHREQLDDTLADTLRAYAPDLVILVNPITTWSDDADAWWARLTAWRAEAMNTHREIILVQTVPSLVEPALHALTPLRALADSRWQIAETGTPALFLSSLDARSDEEGIQADRLALLNAGSPFHTLQNYRSQ